MGGKSKRRARPVEAKAPTPEQQTRGDYELGDVVDRDGAMARRIGKAFRRVRMVETLERRGFLSTEEARALKHYRHHADLADCSPVRDSLNHQRGGSGAGPTVAVINALRVVQACESAAASVRLILRAVVVDDVSLSQWAIDQGGALEGGLRLRPRPKELQIAQLEIRMAARRVMAELDA